MLLFRLALWVKHVIDTVHYKLCRYPTFFDDIAARLLPVIPLIVYRLIENDAIEPADRVLALYSQFLAYHPLRFTFVRDILAYFYGHLPGKLIVRILNVLDLSKVIIVLTCFPCYLFVFWSFGMLFFFPATYFIRSKFVLDTIFWVIPTAH